MAKKKRGKIHADRKSELRPLKKGEKIVYGGAMFHIVKKDQSKNKKTKR